MAIKKFYLAPVSKAEKRESAEEAEHPAIWVTDLAGVSRQLKLMDVNPQQKAIIW